MFDEELAAGVLLTRVTVAISDIEARFQELVLRHTRRHGFRTYDIMHVAAALHLGCGRFFSFDNKAVKLAELEGLEVL